MCSSSHPQYPFVKDHVAVMQILNIAVLYTIPPPVQDDLLTIITMFC